MVPVVFSATVALVNDVNVGPLTAVMVNALSKLLPPTSVTRTSTCLLPAVNAELLTLSVLPTIVKRLLSASLVPLPATSVYVKDSEPLLVSVAESVPTVVLAAICTVLDVSAMSVGAWALMLVVAAMAVVYVLLALPALSLSTKLTLGLPLNTSVSPEVTV